MPNIERKTKAFYRQKVQPRLYIVFNFMLVMLVTMSLIGFALPAHGADNSDEKILKQIEQLDRKGKEVMITWELMSMQYEDYYYECEITKAMKRQAGQTVQSENCNLPEFELPNMGF